MKNLYILQTTEEDYIRKLDKNDSDIVSFDYTSHMELVKKKISHKLLDDFLEDEERRGFSLANVQTSKHFLKNSVTTLLRFMKFLSRDLVISKILKYPRK